MFSTWPFVHAFRPSLSSFPIVLKTNEPISLQIGTSGRESTEMKLSTLGASRSGSRDTDVRFEAWRRHNCPPLELRTIGFIVCLIVLSGLSVYIFCSVLSCIVSATLECRFTS